MLSCPSEAMRQKYWSWLSPLRDGAMATTARSWKEYKSRINNWKHCCSNTSPDCSLSNSGEVNHRFQMRAILAALGFLEALLVPS